MNATRAVSINLEVPYGAVVEVCTVDDRPDIVDLYRASNSASSLGDILFDLNDAKLPYWSAFKDREGRIRVAMLPCTDGVVYVVANPHDLGSDDLIGGFVELAQRVRARHVAHGVQKFFVAYGAGLEQFGEILERAGFVGAPLIVRSMQFTGSGELARRN